MEQYFNIDGMKPGESIRLRVTVQNAWLDRFPEATPVTVTRSATGWRYESAYGVTAGFVDGEPRVNPGHQGMNAHVKFACGAPYAIRSVSESALLREAYRLERQGYARTGREESKGYRDSRHREGYGRRAAFALERARERVARYLAGDASALPRYIKAGIWSGLGGSDGSTSRHFGTRGRWIESPESKGLRFIGLCSDYRGDGSRRAEYGAWYLDADGSETVSGVVYQLPARAGKVRYLAGYADPWNIDKAGRGPAWLSVEVIEGDATDSDYGTPDALREAYREADAIAERMAEDKREHAEAVDAGRDAREKAASALEAGKAWLSTLRVIRAERRAVCVAFRERFEAVRDGVPLAMTRAWLRDRIADIRDNLESSADAERGEYEAARREAVEALDTLPNPPRYANPDYLQRAESLRSAWRDGYAEGSL